MWGKLDTLYYIVKAGSFWEAAEKGMGIIVSYEAMMKRRKSNFVRILRGIQREKIQYYFVCPKK